MSAIVHKRTRKYRQQSRIFNGKYSFDYVTLPLENDEINPKLTAKENDSSADKDKDAWRKEFTDKLELCVLNKQIQERLKVTAKAQLNWLAPCFRTPDREKNSAARRRCFCDCIGPKFCEICRRKVEKELSNRVPRIIMDLKHSENELILVEREEFFVTPEPKFSKHLKQASILCKLEGYQSSPGDKTTLTADDQGLSIENPNNHAISRASSYSSLTSSKDGEVVKGVIVSSSPQNTPTTSPVVFELPIINNPRSSPDIPNDQSASSSCPQLPAITNEPHLIYDQQNSPVSPNDQHTLTFCDIPQSPEITNEPEIPNGSQMFHITHQLRSINELKADATFPNNPSEPNASPITPEQLSSNVSDSSKATQSVLDKSSDSLKTDVEQTDTTDHILPKLRHPVEPVLLELKYINFSIYDYDCNLDK